MITPLDFLFDLFNPSLAFLPRALAAVTLASLVTGVVGCHVMMRGMVFIGDAVAHSVFPGLAVAFVIGGNLVFGGLIAGVITAVLVAIFSQNQKLREDSVIGIFFAGSFALGIVIISLAPGIRGRFRISCSVRLWGFHAAISPRLRLCPPGFCCFCGCFIGSW